ncbi:MAG: DNA translocase FtsK [bacterium]
MAKKKKSKNSKGAVTYNIELTGLILILIGILGFGFGVAGTLFKKFSLFLGGSYWFLLLIALLYIGSYMLVKRSTPEFASSRLIGFYIVLVVVLSSAHYEILAQEVDVNNIFMTTYDNYVKRMNTINSNNALGFSGTGDIGGGLIGCIFISIFGFIGGVIGSKIILFILFIFGTVLLFDLNISEILENFFVRLKNTFAFLKPSGESTRGKEKVKVIKKEEIIEEPIEDEQTNFEEDYNDYPAPIPVEEVEEKIIVSSIDDIKNRKPEVSQINEAYDEESFSSEEEYNNSEIEQKEEEIIDETGYKLPTASILNPVQIKKTTSANNAEINNKKKLLKGVCSDFGLNITIKSTNVAPAVTQFEVTVPQGTKVNKIVSINKEIALAMAAKDVRIQAPIPGKSTIGIEIPNDSITAVGFREVLEDEIGKHDDKLFVALGRDLMGKCVVEDLTKTPHLLVAGSTGSGKSVCINTMIISILMRYKPSEVRLVMVDPKKVELTNYNGIPHLLCPVVSDPKKASLTLQKIVSEMEKRYDTFSDNVVKNISGYNEMIDKHNKKNPDNIQPRMPYILVIIDELADLMLVASKEVEDSIARITQMARAAGIHLIVATQRPSTDVITGLIKNNIPSRIAFSVSSAIDSRTILDSSGAEKLLGKGDMLYLPMGESTSRRVQGCFISDDEIKNVIDHCKNQMSAKYDETLVSAEPVISASGTGNSEGGDDPMYDEIVDFAMETGKISASLIQRRFRFGYNRAARMMDLLESRGIVGEQNGSKPREVIKRNEE